MNKNGKCRVLLGVSTGLSVVSTLCRWMWCRKAEAGSKTGSSLSRCWGSAEQRVSYLSVPIANTTGSTGPLNADLGAVLQGEIRDSPWTLDKGISAGQEIANANCTHDIKYALKLDGFFGSHFVALLWALWVSLVPFQFKSHCLPPLAQCLSLLL